VVQTSSWAPGVKEAGGLAIIGTERHESRRVDRQLRGRAGRQGDPGSSQFFVSLEDDLMRLFGSERIASLMDKMGHKDGEVLQHSMISKSIERAQRKVEENNFGMRKRLLEYDDVMNAQRDVIYKRRNHALFGERLSIDLDNAMYDVCVSLATKFEDERDYMAFKIEVMKHLALEPEVAEAEFAKADLSAVGDKLYHQAKDFYTRKMNGLREHMLPTLEQIYKENGDKVENIVIPFTDGIRGLQVYVDLKEAISTGAKPVVESLEKNMTLALIDDAWKDHLRAMDDLRHSVQMASYEQKDPLLIYKFEAFNLFKQMLLETNQEYPILPASCWYTYAGSAANRPAQMPEQHTDMSQLRSNKAEIDAARSRITQPMRTTTTPMSS
jgi:preprotein translocase subunit SecA